MQINFTINIDDRIIARIRKFFTKRNNIAFVFIGIIATTAIVYGATITKPWDFNEGELIDANKMNDNFDALFAAVNGPTFGAWAEKSLTTIHLAETDGFIFGTVNTYNSGGSSVIDMFKLYVADVSEGINFSGAPVLKNHMTIGSSVYAGVPFFFPVPKGKYWAISSDVASADIKLYWCPVGN